MALQRAEFGLEGLHELSVLVDEVVAGQPTRCSSSTVTPTIYTKINCFDRLGSS